MNNLFLIISGFWFLYFYVVRLSSTTYYFYDVQKINLFRSVQGIKVVQIFFWDQKKPFCKQLNTKCVLSTKTGTSSSNSFGYDQFSLVLINTYSVRYKRDELFWFLEDLGFPPLAADTEQCLEINESLWKSIEQLLCVIEQVQLMGAP